MSSIIGDQTTLHQVSEKVEANEDTISIINRLESILSNHDNGYGLSAIQIGIPKRISVLKKKNGEFIHLINPEVIEKDDEFTFHGEGCLSFPGLYLDTQRYKQVSVRNQVIENGSLREEKLCFYYSKMEEAGSDGIIAIAVQHEIDHMNGITITDHGKSFEKGTTIVRDSVKISRNDPCPCGSGKKYKKCCLK